MREALNITSRVDEDLFLPLKISQNYRYIKIEDLIEVDGQ